MPAGRPTTSKIRQNILEILHYLHQGYGYEISKIYNEVFPPVTQRSIYYHLRKGVSLNELAVHEIKHETGDFSWGRSVEKIYYTLGKNAEPKGEKRVKQYLTKCNKLPTQQPSQGKFTRFVRRFRKGK